jgi:hypothetical protein
MAVLYFEINPSTFVVEKVRNFNVAPEEYNTEAMSQDNGKNFLAEATIVKEPLGDNQKHGAPVDSYAAGQALRTYPAVPLTTAELEEKRQAEKADALSKSTVTVGVHTFDANEVSLARMGNAILAAEQLGLTEHYWKMHDNTVVLIQLPELKQAHAAGMQALGAIVLS